MTDQMKATYVENPVWEEIEEAPVLWAMQAQTANLTISGSILLNKAQRFASLLNITDFWGSNGWLNKFKLRHNLKQYNKHGDRLPEERERLQNLISDYSLHDVFNCDETGLYQNT
ncbi:2657_t:CDS:2 [Entrophospora sp. SA101]|nr:2657_t:CDS:2 [Entrophospora sp. SA101]